MADPIADRLKVARKARGFRTAKEFAEKHGIPQPTYAMHEKGTRGLKREVALEYAEHLDVTLDWLLKGEGDAPAQVNAEPERVQLRPIQVVGYVEAGSWVPAQEWDAEDLEEILVSEDLRDHEAFGLKVRGPSMNERYPDGSVVVVVPLLNFWRELENGDDVICQCHEHDLIESTIKELSIDERGAWLWPRSTDPAHQMPIQIPWPPVEGDEVPQNIVTIRAVVVAAYTIKVRR